MWSRNEFKPETENKLKGRRPEGDDVRNDSKKDFCITWNEVHYFSDWKLVPLSKIK